jgi:hypothetical protein
VPAAQKVNFDNPIPLQNGRALAVFTSKAVDGRYRGWLCRPDGTRLENLLVRYVSEADARAAVLMDKGKL